MAFFKKSTPQSFFVYKESYSLIIMAGSFAKISKQKHADYNTFD